MAADKQKQHNGKLIYFFSPSSFYCITVGKIFRWGLLWQSKRYLYLPWGYLLSF